MFEINQNDFDSGLLAPKVGVVAFKNQNDVNASAEDVVLAAAHRLDFDLLYWKLPKKFPLRHFYHTGELISFVGSFEEAILKMKRFTNRFHIGEVNASDWSEIEDLLQHSSKTRFSLDPKISTDLAVRHKMKLLKKYAEMHPNFFLKANDEQGRVVGIQLSYPSEDSFNLYEIVIDPAYRTGFLAFALLAENLVRAESLKKQATFLKTKIYAANVNSRRLFQYLGLKADEEVEHWYHYWT